MLVQISNGGTINNSGSWTLDSFNIQNGGGIGSNTFNNTGTTGVMNVVNNSTISSVFNDTSTALNALTVGTGTLTLSGSGAIANPINLAAGTALNFNGAAYTLSNATPITGTGTVSFSNGTLDFVSGSFANNLTWNGSTLLGTLTTTGSVAVTTGNFTLGTGAVWNTSGPVTITSGGWGYVGTNATLNNSGSFDIGNNFGINFNGTSGAQFNNILGGTVTLSGIYSAPITGTGGTFSNAGTLTKTTTTAQTLSSLSNSGTVNLNGAGAVAVSGATTNTGTINVNASTLALNGQTSSSGAINLATGTGLTLAGATTLSGGAITGVGASPIRHRQRRMDIEQHCSAGIR